MIGQVDAQPNKPAVLHQASLDDAREQGDVDIPAADEDSYFLAAEMNLVLQHCSCGDSARAFAERLFLLKQEQNGIGDFFFVDCDDVVDVALDERKSESAGAANSNAVRD